MYYTHIYTQHTDNNVEYWMAGAREFLNSSITHKLYHSDFVHVCVCMVGNDEGKKIPVRPTYIMRYRKIYIKYTI